MATNAQLAANQANARHSTGPRTTEGKQASARNATAHGICSREFVILPGEQEHFDELMAALEADLAPAGAFEQELFRQAAHAAWTLRRIRLAEVDLLVCQDDFSFDPLLVDANEAKLKRLDIYARRADRAFQRAVHELRATQTERQYRTAVESIPRNDAPQSTIRRDSPLVAWLSIHPQVHTGRRVIRPYFPASEVNKLIDNIPLRNLVDLAIADQPRR